jgi:hypothetical protein
MVLVDIPEAIIQGVRPDNISVVVSLDTTPSGPRVIIDARAIEAGGWSLRL